MALMFRRSTCPWVALTVLLHPSGGLPREDGSQRVGVQKHLFIDDHLMDKQRTKGITLQVNPPLFRGRVIRMEQPFERQFGLHYFSQVLEYGGEYRLYYHLVVEDEKGRRAQPCLAVSKDGIRWVKPSLGVVELHGSKNNNAIEAPSRTGGFVFLDPKAPSSRRFRLIGELEDGSFGIVGQSEDGIRFRGPSLRLLPFRSDTQNVVFWDDERKRYVFYLRGRRDGQRTVLRAEATTLEAPLSYKPNPHPLRQWPDAYALTTELPIVMAAQRRDWANWAGGKEGTVDVYNTAAMKYPWAPGTYLAFPSIYYHYTEDTEPRAVSTNDGEFEVQLATSRDGLHWGRYRVPYLARGTYEGLKLIMLCMAQGMIRRGDEVYQYFVGLPRSHGWAAFLNGEWGAFLKDPARHKAWQEADQGGIYLAVQRLDGFVAATAGPEGGRLVTKPLIFRGSRLSLNIRTAGKGQARVAVTDEGGKELPGLGLRDCVPIRGDSVEHAVAWRGGESLSACAGKPVRLVFQLTNASLYSFAFH